MSGYLGDLSPLQNKKLCDLRRLLEKNENTSDLEKFASKLSDKELLRALRARDFKVKVSRSVLLEKLEWELTYKPTFSPQSPNHNMAMPKPSVPANLRLKDSKTRKSSLVQISKSFLSIEKTNKESKKDPSEINASINVDGDDSGVHNICPYAIKASFDRNIYLLLGTEKERVPGRDKNGCQVFVTIPRNQARNSSKKEFFDCLIYSFLAILENMDEKNHEEGFTWIIDLEGFNMDHMDYGWYLQMKYLLETCFYERVSKMIFHNASTSFSLLWKSFSFLSPISGTKNKTFWTQGNELARFINLDLLPIQYGGKSTLEAYHPWRKAHEIMETV